MESLEDKYKKEFEELKALRNNTRTDEIEYKNRMKSLNLSLKVTKQQFSHRNRLRKQLDKKIKTFWQKKKAVLYRHRKWAIENPGKTYEVVTHA